MSINSPYHASSEEITAVKCLRCGKIFEKDSPEFISVHGNICIGMNGGVVGNNLSSEGKVINVTIFCLPCLIASMEKSFGEQGPHV